MKATRWLLPCLMLGGLLARVVYLGEVAALPFFDDPVGDSARYLDRARGILSGDPTGDRPFFYGGIFYPWLLAACLLLSGGSLYPVCLLQALAGVALGWVVYRVVLAAARPVEGSPPGGPSTAAVAVTAAGFVLFYGPLAFLEADILMISWTILLMMAGALLLLEWCRDEGRTLSLARPALAGIGLGLAASERPNLVALLPALAVWLACFAPRGKRARGAALLLAGGALVVGGIALINHAASGRWVMLTTSTGINFYIGNNPDARGTFDEPWSRADPEFTASHTDLEEASLSMARRATGRQLDPVEASRYWLSRGLSFLRDHPGPALRITFRKVALFWGAREVPNHLDFEFLRSQAPALWLMPLTFGLAAPLGLYGLIAPEARARMTREGGTLLGILVLVPMATVIPFFVADRYRAPVVPPLAAAAAFGVAAIVRGLRGRLTRRRAVLHVACLALAGFALRSPLADFDRSRDHWLLAQAWKKRGDLPRAVRAYEEALALAPAPASEALIRNNLGVALASLGREERARDEYRRAIEIAPALSRPRRNLGLSLMKEGPRAAEEAFANLDLAERADPGDLDVARALAVLYLARGQIVEARLRADRVLRSLPSDPSARAVMDRIPAPAP